MIFLKIKMPFTVLSYSKAATHIKKSQKAQNKSPEI